MELEGPGFGAAFSQFLRTVTLTRLWLWINALRRMLDELEEVAAEMAAEARASGAA